MDYFTNSDGLNYEKFLTQLKEQKITNEIDLKNALTPTGISLLTLKILIDGLTKVNRVSTTIDFWNALTITEILDSLTVVAPFEWNCRLRLLYNPI
jgi:hypothetical protein